MAGGSRTQHLFVLMFLCLKMRVLCRFLGGHVGTAPTTGMTVSWFLRCFATLQHDKRPGFYKENIF